MSDPELEELERMERAEAEAAAEATADEKPAKKPTNWWEEFKGLLFLLLGVLALHSFIVKPFYIPSESMMPGLLVGDQLIVSKYPYGWSWVSASFHLVPEFGGKLLGKVPERGDIVILTPVGTKEDWIKRVIGLPGDTIELRAGQPFINGRPVKQEVQPQADFAVDPNNLCRPADFPGALVRGADGKMHCMVNIVRETLPNGVSYDTIDARQQPADDFPPIKVPAGHVFVLGDNRDNSADSRFPAPEGLGGPIPLDNIGGRAEFTTLSFDGSATWNPLTWFSAIRDGRSFESLRPTREAEPPAR